MGIQLKQTLRRLCDEIGWSYAVFWRPFCRGNQLNLVWGDGYCEMSPGGGGVGMLGFEESVIRNSRDGVCLLVYKQMVTEIHVVGDGMVGQAALTGNHQWILHNAHYGSVAKAMAAMNHQFSAGIQTIAIIPVLPHGVLQLGSTQMKSGKIPAEGQQRNDYNIFQTLLESAQYEEQQSCDELLRTSLDSSWQSSIIPVQESKTSVSSVSGENHASASDSPNITGIDNSTPLNTEGCLSPVLFTSGDDLFDLLDVHNKSGGFHGCLDDVFVQGTGANVHEMSSDVSTCITQKDKGTFFDASKEQNCSEEKYCSGLFSQASPDQLLDAIVAQINSVAKQNLDDDVSCKTSLIQTSSATSGWLASSSQMNGKCSGISSMLVKSETACSNSAISACAMEKNGECSQKDGGYKSKISLWDEKGQNVEYGSISAAHGKRIDEAGKLNKKRSRPGENPRPRPKDRQMIQDRVKELREIVPNGAKCSIDALLEKTIKHMLFLQSVTKHADKLKDVGEPKIVSKEGGLLLKDNFEGGATWAFEIGTQSMICPIIVEDLNVPRQMLVEMLCDEQGLFLEIADLIKGLGLTILKGVLEARKDKVWARFAVEANRDVTRMEIFLSLVRLLEPNGGSSTVPQGVECVDTQHNMFHPFSLHAAGMSDCL